MDGKPGESGESRNWFELRAEANVSGSVASVTIIQIGSIFMGTYGKSATVPVRLGISYAKQWKRANEDVNKSAALALFCISANRDKNAVILSASRASDSNSNPNPNIKIQSQHTRKPEEQVNRSGTRLNPADPDTVAPRQNEVI